MDVFWLVLVLISALLLHVIRKLPDQVGSETRNSAARARVFFSRDFPQESLGSCVVRPRPPFPCLRFGGREAVSYQYAD